MTYAFVTFSICIKQAKGIEAEDKIEIPTTSFLCFIWLNIDLLMLSKLQSSFSNNEQDFLQKKKASGKETHG